MKAIPRSATPTTAPAETAPARRGGASAPMKMLATRIWVGQRPLQREKLLVTTAISRSRGLSITRVATTPAALQPNPMLMVRACLPWAPARRKSESRLKATRGRYPKSSSRVKRGKKIAIGGSITLTTQAVARYTPSKRKPESHQGIPTQAPKSLRTGWRPSTRRVASIADGTLAPAIVVQKTAARIASMRGKPVTRLVSHRSSFRSKTRPAVLASRRTTAPAIRSASRYRFSASRS